MDRAAIGLGAAYLRLGAELISIACSMKAWKGFDVAAVAERQASAKAAVGLD